MALSEKQIRRIISIEMRLTGKNSESKAVLDGLLKQFNALGAASSANLRVASGEIRNLANAVKQSNPAFIAQLRSMEATDKAAGGLGKAVVNLSEHFGRLRAGVSAALGPLNSLGALVGEGIGFEKSVKYLIEFNAAILKSGAQFSKYGMGVTDLEKQTDRLSKTLSLTRKETLALQSQIEKGLNYAGWSRGGQLLNNIKQLVGPNADAIGDMANFVTSIGQKFPDLEDSLVRMNTADRKLIDSQSRLLYLSGQISQADSKRLREYSRMSEQVSVADLKHRRELEAQQEAMKNTERMFENIALTLGNLLLPYVVKLTSYLQENENKLVSWIPTLTKIAGIFAAMSIAAKGIGMMTTIARFAGVGNQLGGMGGSVTGARISQIGSATGSIAMGAGAAYGANRLYDATMNPGVGRGWAKVGTDAAIGASIGSRFGGMGAVAGAGIGMVAGATDETVTTTKEVNASQLASLRQTQQMITKLAAEKKKYAEAGTPEQAKYNAAMREYNQLLAVATALSHKNDGIFGGVSNDAGAKEKYKAAHDALMKAQDTDYFKKQMASAAAINASNAAVKPATASGAYSNLISGGGAFNPKALQEANAKFETAYGNTSVQNVLSNASSDTLKDYGLADIAKAGTPFTVNSKEMARTQDAYSRAGENVEKAKATGDTGAMQKAQKAQEEIAAQLEQRTIATAKLSSEESQITGFLAEQDSIIESQLKLFQSQSKYVDAIGQKMYLTGKVDIGALFTAADEAAKSLNTSLDNQAAKLQNIIIEQQKSNAAMTKQINDDEYRLKNEQGISKEERSQLEERVESTKMHLQLGKSIITEKTAQLDIDTDLANRAQMQTQNYLKMLAPMSQLAALQQTRFQAISSELALQLQYGNNSKKNYQLSVEAVKSIEDQVGTFTQQLYVVQRLRKLFPENTEYQKQEAEISGKINGLKSQELQVIQNISQVNQANVSYAQAMADKAEALVSLQDNLAMGVAASAQARMQAADAIGREVTENQKNITAMQQYLSQTNLTQDQRISAETKVTQLQTQQLGLMSKQAQITKSIRDGWVQSIQAMTAGTGIFAKIMITQEKNLGVGVTYMKGMVQSMRSGGVDLSGRRSVGQRQAERFGVGGITGQNDPSRRPDFYNGGPEIAGKVRSTEDKIKYLAKQNARVNNFGAQGFGAAPNQGAYLQQNMTKPSSPISGAPGAPMSAGPSSGGGGGAVFNVTVNADLSKSLGQLTAEFNAKIAELKQAIARQGLGGSNRNATY